MNFFLKMFIGDNKYSINLVLEYKKIMFMTKWEIEFLV